MRNVCFKKGLVVGIILLLIGIGFIPNYIAISIKDETTITIDSAPVNYTILACLFGRIENLRESQTTITFDAVNLFVVSFILPGFYHLNSGEEIQISCLMDDVFPIFGILTDNFIFAISSPGW